MLIWIFVPILSLDEILMILHFDCMLISDFNSLLPFYNAERKNVKMFLSILNVSFNKHINVIKGC